MKRRILSLIFALVMVFSVVGCTKGRTNSAKNLKIVDYDKNAKTYVLQYIGSELDFGDLYITITDEKVVNFYCTYDSKYKLGDYQFKVGDNVSQLTITDADNKVTLALKNPLKLIKSVDEDGIETVNDKKLSLYLEFEDANTVDEETTTTTTAESSEESTEDTTTTTVELIESSTITLSTTATDLITFIRNEAPNTGDEE